MGCADFSICTVNRGGITSFRMRSTGRRRAEVCGHNTVSDVQRVPYLRGAVCTCCAVRCAACTVSPICSVCLIYCPMYSVYRISDVHYVPHVISHVQRVLYLRCVVCTSCNVRCAACTVSPMWSLYLMYCRMCNIYRISDVQCVHLVLPHVQRVPYL